MGGAAAAILPRFPAFTPALPAAAEGISPDHTP
jgi:hypothetical protein